jgi:cytochrome c oxidase subunit 2
MGLARFVNNFRARVAALLAVAMAGAAGAASGPAMAAAEGQPTPWQLGFQPAASLLKIRIEELHDLLLVIITLITIFVTALLAYAMWRFRASNNPKPSTTTHNTMIEVLWTVVPVMILVVIAVPSFRLLYYSDKAKDAEMTLKVVGHQWYWSYEYPDSGNFTFDSYMIPETEIKPGDGNIRLLSVDNRAVIPVDTTIRILITSADVMHSWFVPSLGLQKYALPGRTNEIWVKATKEGVYYGQCNQICGVNHGYMPVAVEVVSKAKYAAWVEDAKKKYAGVDGVSNVQLAAAPAQ